MLHNITLTNANKGNVSISVNAIIAIETNVKQKITIVHTEKKEFQVKESKKQILTIIHEYYKTIHKQNVVNLNKFLNFT